MQNCSLQQKHSFDDYILSPNVLSPAQQYAERGGLTTYSLIIS